MSASWLEASLDLLGDDVRREDLIELCINPDGRKWVEHRGATHMADTRSTVSEKDARDLAHRIASSAKATLSDSNPIISCSVEYRGRLIRAQVVHPPAVSGGVAISLRFFSTLPLDQIELKYLYGQQRSLEALRRERNKELREIVKGGDLYQAIRFCVAHKLNMIIAGGTSTGKTVAARKILSFVPAIERIVTIEDAAELLPPQPNTVTLLADRENPKRTADSLLTATLRLRPDRIVLGEVRGREALTFLEAINTGHGGSLTTLHAETPQLAVQRLAIAALKTEVPMTYADMIDYIEASIDVIIQAGRADGQRGIAEFYLPGDQAEGTAGRPKLHAI